MLKITKSDAILLFKDVHVAKSQKITINRSYVVIILGGRGPLLAKSPI